jgi:hypothetical protein
MKCQHFKSSNKADDLDQLCKLSVHMRPSLVHRRCRRMLQQTQLKYLLDVQSNFQSCAVQGQRISILSWSNVSLSAVMVALEHSIKLR